MTDDQTTHHHAAVEHLDARSTLPEREPVRIYATTPAGILGLAGTLVAFGAGSPLAAVAIAAAIIALCALLELVRGRVTPAPALAPHDPVDGTEATLERVRPAPHRRHQ